MKRGLILVLLILLLIPSISAQRLFVTHDLLTEKVTPGGTAVFQLNVRNNQNVEDTFSITPDEFSIAPFSDIVENIEIDDDGIRTVTVTRVRTGTYVTKDGVPDTTWQEGSVRLNVDYIIKDITSMVQTKFMQKGNTITTRRAIKEEIKARLAKFESSEILVADERTGTPAYKDPVVVQNADDATQADVSIELSPGKPLNFITVAFNVYL